MLSPQKSRKIWDAIVYLKIKCPHIEVTEVLRHLEKNMVVDERQE